jgi:hypothetical protein
MLFTETAQMFQGQWNNGMELELHAGLFGHQSPVRIYRAPNSFILSQNKASEAHPMQSA